MQLGFQRVDDHQAPGWPGTGKQHSHLDIDVVDLAQATKELLAIGATQPQFQPGGDDWVVLADPEGHVFCLVTG
nr:VOC family protein [Fodinicola feengrottensis]